MTLMDRNILQRTGEFYADVAAAYDEMKYNAVSGSNKNIALPIEKTFSITLLYFFPARYFCGCSVSSLRTSPPSTSTEPKTPSTAMPPTTSGGGPPSQPSVAFSTL